MEPLAESPSPRGNALEEQAHSAQLTSVLSSRTMSPSEARIASDEGKLWMLTDEECQSRDQICRNFRLPSPTVHLLLARQGKYFCDTPCCNERLKVLLKQDHGKNKRNMDFLLVPGLMDVNKEEPNTIYDIDRGNKRG